MSKKVFVIGVVPPWLQSLIDKQHVEIDPDEPDAVLIFSRSRDLDAAIEKYNARTIPILSSVKLDHDIGYFQIPEKQADIFLLILLKTLANERDRSPLTHLPGNSVIAEQIRRRILSPHGYWLCYIDMNNFKIYNDRYGFSMGDRLIINLARIMADVAGNRFVGHIGGDDFVCVLKSDDGAVLDSLCDTFDRSLVHYYPEIDYRKDEITGIDRDGDENKFGLVHLSVAVLANEYNDLHELNHAVASVKKIAKEKSKSENRSLWVMDRDHSISHQDDLLRILRGNDRVAKRTAIEVLGEIADEKNLGLFIDLSKDKDYMIRKSAVYAIGKVNKKESIAYLLDALQDPSPHVRMRAAEALGAQYDDQIPGALTRALDDPNYFVLRAVLQSIGRLKLKSALPRVMQLRSEAVEEHVVDALGEIGDESALPFLEDVLRRKTSARQTIAAVGKISSPSSLRILLALLTEKDHEKHKLEILKAIYRFSMENSARDAIARKSSLLLEDLRGPTPYYQLLILSEIQDSSARAEVTRFLTDRRVFMRRAAVLYLSNDQKSLDLIAGRLTGDPVPSIRQTAADVLVKYGSKAVPFLRKALKDVDFHVRRAAAKSIMEILF